MMSWWRNYIRSRTQLIPRERALKTNRLLSAIYFFSAWNALALGVYILFTESHPKEKDEEDKPSKYYARLVGSGDAKAIRLSGFRVVNEYQIESTARDMDMEVKRLREAREAREREEREGKNRQDLNLLVEETNSL